MFILGDREEGRDFSSKQRELIIGKLSACYIICHVPEFVGQSGRGGVGRGRVGRDVAR